MLILGAANAVIWLVQHTYLGTASGGHYVLVVFTMIAFAFLTVVFLNLVPLIVTYNTSLGKKLKNAVILTLAFPVPNLFLLIFFAGAPMIMLAGNFGVIIVFVFFALLGISFFTLMVLNFSDYNSEKILIPLYESVQREQMKRMQGKAKKKKK